MKSATLVKTDLQIEVINCSKFSVFGDCKLQGGRNLLFSPTAVKEIEDICFFEVNTKYISSSELKTSEFSRVRSRSENYYVFNSRDEIYLVFTEKKQIFFLFYTMHRHFPMHKVGGENAKTKFFFENTNNFGTTLFLMF